MEFLSGIYKLQSTIDDRCYVGSAKNLKRRRIDHFKILRSGMHFNKKLLHFFQKHGEGSLVFDILEYVDNIDLLASREQYYMDLIKPHFNIFPFARSSRGVKMSEETKEKLRQKRIGTNHSEATKLKLALISKSWKRTTETKLKISAANKGNQNWFGKKHKPETIEKMKANNKHIKSWLGRRHSDETKRKMSLSASFRKLDENRKWRSVDSD